MTLLQLRFVISTLFITTYAVILCSCKSSDPIVAEPEVAETIYIGTNYDNSLYALDAVDGSIKWVFKAEEPSFSGAIRSTPTVVNDTVYTRSNSILYAINSASGKKIWSYKMNTALSGATSSPTVVNNTVYIGGGTFDGNLYAIDAKTGQKKWIYNVGGSIYSNPTVVNNTVYICNGVNSGNGGNGGLYAIDAITGSKKWSFETKKDINSSPAVANGIVYVGGFDSIFYALDAGTGIKKWEFKAEGTISSSPTVDGGLVYITDNSSKIYALDAEDGSIEWEFKIGTYSSASPIVANGNVYVSCSWDGGAFALSAKTGQKQWESNVLQPGIRSSPNIVGGIMYVGGYSKVHAVDALTGVQKWVTRLSNPSQVIESSPCVVSKNGKVYHSSISGSHQ